MGGKINGIGSSQQPTIGFINEQIIKCSGISIQEYVDMVKSIR